MNFKPDQSLIVQFVNTKYDSAWKNNGKDEIVQAFDDLEIVKEDYENMAAAFEQYQVPSVGAGNIYKLNQDPTSEKVKKTMRSLKNRLNDN